MEDVQGSGTVSEQMSAFVACSRDIGYTPSISVLRVPHYFGSYCRLAD